MVSTLRLAAAVFVSNFALANAAGKVVTIATFDGSKETGSWPWETVNDPVMGGASVSTFKIDSNRQLGVWDGEVKIVPFLKKPGFCNLQAPGLEKTANFPDISGTDGIVVRAREVSQEQGHLTHFNVMLMTKGAYHEGKQGVYMADFFIGGDMADHFVPWSSFNCSWRGQPESWCPEITSQLKDITNIGVGTYFPGPAGKFHVEVESLSASSSVEASASKDIDLATFDGKDVHRWGSENDPVMGGQSESRFAIEKGYGHYSGVCRIVPSLKAPGFTIALTENPIIHRQFPDVSATSGMLLGVKTLGGNVSSFKAAFCDTRLSWICQFKSYKADFDVPANGGEVYIPWSKFSNKWSATTGEHTAESPPTADSLRSISQLQIWTEGVAGSFDLRIDYIRAKASSSQSASNVIMI